MDVEQAGRNIRNFLALIDDLEPRRSHFRLLSAGSSIIDSKGPVMVTVMSVFERPYVRRRILRLTTKRD